MSVFRLSVAVTPAAPDKAVLLLDLLSLLILTPVTSRNILLLPSLPHSIPYRQANVRRRKDAPCVGTATRGSLARLSRLPRCQKQSLMRLHNHWRYWHNH